MKCPCQKTFWSLPFFLAIGFNGWSPNVSLTFYRQATSAFSARVSLRRSYGCSWRAMSHRRPGLKSQVFSGSNGDQQMIKIWWLFGSNKLNIYIGYIIQYIWIYAMEQKAVVCFLNHAGEPSKMVGPVFGAFWTWLRSRFQVRLRMGYDAPLNGDLNRDTLWLFVT